MYVCTYVCVCVCACCMRRLVPCPSRPLTSSLLASICTYSSLEPVASGPQVALRHTRHARRQRRSARRDGEVTVLGQHIALPITSKTCPGIPPYPQIPPSYSFLSFSLSFVVHNSRFEFVLLLYSPLLILIPFQEVAPSAAHQSVRHTLQLQGAPCRRTRSQGGLQGELQGEVGENINPNSDTVFIEGEFHCAIPAVTLCVQGINMLGA